MNIRKFAILGIAATLSVTTAFAAHADSFNVTVVAGHPPVFRWVKMMSESYIPAVKTALEGTGHDMTFTEQYGGSIAGVGEELETVQAGLAEIGICLSLFDPAKLAPQNVTYYTPFASDDIRLVNKVMGDLQRNNPAMQQAWADNDLVYLGGNITIDDYLVFTNFPVTTLDDLKGHKIASAGPALNWLSGTGAIGVSGNLTTYYNEIKTGVYEGAMLLGSAGFPGKYHEVAPNILKVGFGPEFAGAICANKDWYEGLPDEVKTALTDAASTAESWYLDSIDADVKSGLEAMQKEGATLTVATDDMRRQWAAGIDNAAKVWASELDAQNKQGSAVLDAYMNAMRDAGAQPLRDWDKK
ncbi:C4-dicarboxylate TRAP transporter substrate-binding protein [Antarctobacter sp.]|uniref:C4-dicarboxylate TRAP transporter substrate-binding protein n=1 Tax=Antarctobacter sp. TaxID=1872577 RepID=UPI003A8DA566